MRSRLFIGWFLCVLSGLAGGCTKDITEFREYFLGTWIQETCNGDTIPGCKREIMYFKGYSSFSLQRPMHRTGGVLQDCRYDNGYYSIYCYTFTGYIGVDDPWDANTAQPLQLYEQWNLQKCTDSFIRSEVLTKEYNYERDSAAIGKVFTWKRLDSKSALPDTLVTGKWMSVKRNGQENHDLLLSFNDQGAYTLGLLQHYDPATGKGSYQDKTDEQGTYVATDWFLRLRNYNNPILGREGQFALSGWRISYSHTAEGYFYLHLDSLDGRDNFVFAYTNG